MIQFVQEYDFHEMLLPHGEDDISFSCSNGNFMISITYDDTKKLKLHFARCYYQAFHPIPGANILCESLDFWGGFAGCVYRVEGSELLANCRQYASDTGLPFKAKYFYCRFDSSNLGFHIVANELTHEVVELT